MELDNQNTLTGNQEHSHQHHHESSYEHHAHHHEHHHEHSHEHHEHHHEHHHHDDTPQNSAYHHKDRKCSPRRMRKVADKVLTVLLVTVAVLIMAACVWIAVYGVY